VSLQLNRGDEPPRVCCTDLGRADPIAERHAPAGTAGGPHEEVHPWC
jgi:hypothetical protein